MSAQQSYPDRPGYKTEGTSKEAATAITGHAKTVRDRVLAYITEHAGITADEIANAMGLSILTVRPRVSELRRQGWIEPTGERFCNSSGMSANAWTLAPPLPTPGGEPL